MSAFLLIYFFTLGILTLSPSSPTLRGHLPQSHASPSRFVSYKNFVWTPLLPRSAQLIRALALRVLASLRVPDIVQIQLFELRRMIKDVCVGARFPRFRLPPCHYSQISHSLSTLEKGERGKG